MKVLRLLVLMFLFPFCGIAQSLNLKEPMGHSGKFYISWGWNSSFFSNADFSFTGNDFNFSLKDVAAQDKQSPFGLDPYFHPTKFTIPQTNFRVAYFFSDQWNVSLGFDHMKYVVEKDQVVSISGEIFSGGSFDGTYSDDSIQLTRSFLQLEHTDGLNYINVELRKVSSIVAFKSFDLNLVLGGGVAALVPKTKTVLFSQYYTDAFRLSGIGIAPLIGLKLYVGDWFFLQSEFKAGYIHMPNVRITENVRDRASHSFFFGQINYVFGFSRRF